MPIIFRHKFKIKYFTLLYMVKSHLISRIGSKTNDIKFFKELLPMDIKTIVEPFGGSFALIRDVYFEDKYKKYVNDLDPNLYYIYTHIDDLINGYKLWNKINDLDIKTREKIELLKKQDINNDIKQYIYKSQIVRGSITKTKNIDVLNDDIKLIEKIHFSNIDAFKFMDNFLYDKDTFIFLDPPYLFSDNKAYNPQKEDTDATDYYVYFLNILKDKNIKAKIMIIINDLKILRWIFKDFIKGEYNKTYQIAKKLSKHLIITNY